MLAGAFVAQVVGALLPNTLLLAVATAVGLATDAALHRWQRRTVTLMAKAHADVTVRQLLRDLLLVVGLLRIEQQSQESVFLPVVIGLLVLYALHFTVQAVSVKVRRSRTLPFVTRNIDASALRLSSAPPSLLTRRAGHRLLAFGAPATLGLLVTAIVDDGLPSAIGVAVSVALMAVGLVRLTLHLLPSRRPVSEEEALAWLDAWLAEYRPTVGMYFSGGTTSAYQANMWLEPLAALNGRPVIVLRERFMVQKIAATDIPVICLPKVATLMRLEHSTLRMMIHPANSGKTSQILRVPTIKHAFVNHGESDKLSSCNPYAKAYDEVWVAGPAARERYALADVGIDDRDVVEVGRPQLDPVLPYAGPPTGTYTTVLYAPTWEGWDGNPGNTSVVLAGENIVRALLADPGVRLLYKPHPMTGSVDPRAGAANERIQAMIREANRRRPAISTPTVDAAELARRTAELERATSSSFRAAADDVERMLAQGEPDSGRAAEVERATAAWDAAYWGSFDEARHQIITAARPGIFSCFNQADVLISDVSSVVSDWLASEKPYAVANTSGMTEDEFRAAFTTVRAATILAPTGDGVPGLLAAVRDPDQDTLVKDRAELKLHLLGPSDPPSVSRLRDAARALEQKTLLRGTARPDTPASGIPTQRDHLAAADTADPAEAAPSPS
ncbi:hypothetical protein ACWGUN_00360 [Streptomyces koyangensis]|uniref:Integral membrane protein n=1 Tax=Streptomyces koyangensis TaxID=188770 RepID=A0A385DFV2_9ACTN|nr:MULTISPECIES: hypothetical protein [Streptomyces]AXQ57268.1 hypothetical protein D0C37_23480 [Streptomyces koyangensis]PKR46893.1 hypothetical protein CWE27_02740 [Streptomyces sp. EAG2]